MYNLALEICGNMPVPKRDNLEENKMEITKEMVIKKIDELLLKGEKISCYSGIDDDGYDDYVLDSIRITNNRSTGYMLTIQSISVKFFRYEDLLEIYNYLKNKYLAIAESIVKQYLITGENNGK